MDLLTQLKHKKILLIDDDEWIRDSMGSFFDSEGCLFQAVESAEAGIDEYIQKPFDMRDIEDALSRLMKGQNKTMTGIMKGKEGWPEHNSP